LHADTQFYKMINIL